MLADRESISDIESISERERISQAEMVLVGLGEEFDDSMLQDCPQYAEGREKLELWGLARSYRRGLISAAGSIQKVRRTARLSGRRKGLVRNREGVSGHRKGLVRNREGVSLRRKGSVWHWRI